MAKTLDVYLHDVLVGHLIQEDSGQMVFDHAASKQSPGTCRLGQHVAWDIDTAMSQR